MSLGHFLSFARLGLKSATTRVLERRRAALSRATAGVRSSCGMDMLEQRLLLASISINDITFAEGNSGTTNATFTITLSQAAASDVTVNYATSNDTATAGTDYTETTGVATIAAGQTNTTITIPVLGDTSIEPSETFKVTLTDPNGADLAKAIGIATITNDDLPKVSISDTTITEGNSGTANAVFTVTLSELASSDVTVNYATANGTATSGGDYTNTAGVVTIPAGQLTATISIPVHSDSNPEKDEQFYVTLSNPNGATLDDNKAVGTITNDDLPTISIDDIDIEINEGATTPTAKIRVKLSAAVSSDVVVHYTTVDGTGSTGAKAGEDYTATSGDLTIAANQTSAEIEIPITNDTAIEVNETFKFVLSDPTGGTLNSYYDEGTVTIIDNDVPTLSIADITITEGSSGTTNATFTITLSAAPAQSVSLQYQAVSGTALGNGLDFDDTLAILTFQPGETTKTVTVNVKGDSKWEQDETFTLNLSNISGATATTTSATCTIVNDDIGLSIGDVVSIVEGNNGTSNAVFTVTLSAASATDITVNYTTANGTATAGSDFTATSGVLTIPAGQTTASISVPVLGDTTFEPHEKFTVVLSNPVGVDLVDATGEGTITDDESAITVENVTIEEGASGTKNMVFAVTVDPAATGPVSVRYATSNGTAIAGTDYTATSGVLNIPFGQTSATINVPIKGDTSVEGDETITLTLSDATGAGIRTTTATGTITNDDLPTVSISNVTISEGNTGTREAIFQVNLSSAASAVTVNYATANGTAEAGTDYTATSGELTIPAGQTFGIIRVPILGDTAKESNETFTVVLSDPSRATLDSVRHTATGTINNDDYPTVTIGNIEVQEADGKEAVFTVTLGEASDVPVTVKYSTIGGTAVAGSDFKSQNGVVTFDPGQTTREIRVPLINDSTYEVSESFTVRLSEPTNGTLDSEQDEGTCTITNDDLPTLSIGNVEVVEGDNETTTLTFTVTLSATLDGKDVTVNYATSSETGTGWALPGDPSAGGDYQGILNGTLTIPAGQNSKTFTVTIYGDKSIESTEKFIATLSNPTNAALHTTQYKATGTIINDDPTIKITDASLIEGNSGKGTMKFTVELSTANPDSPITVRYKTEPGTASAGSDYEHVTGTLTFAPGERTKEIEVPILGDTRFEQHETFKVKLEESSGGVISSTQGTATGTITNDDLPTLQILDTTVYEGNGTNSYSYATFTVQLTDGVSNTAVKATSAVTFSYGTVDIGGSTGAVAGEDYIATTNSPTATIAAGSDSTYITVQVKSDNTIEPDELFQVLLSNVSNAVLSETNSIAKATIRNDDPTITIGNANLAEGNSGNTMMEFKVTLTSAATSPITINYKTTNSSATDGTDYTGTQDGVLVIPAGANEGKIEIPVIGDSIYESSETFTVTLSSTSSGYILTSQATGTITNDDSRVTISNPTAVTEGPDTNLVFTVTRDAPTDGIVTVRYTTSNSTAVAGSDYVFTNGQLTFAATETSKTITVPLLNDALAEASETFTVVLSDLVGASFSSTATTASATGTINDDDPAPFAGINDVSVAEGHWSTTDAVFTVTLSAVSGKSVAVNYQVIADTAGISDVNVVSGSVSFAPGETQKQIRIPVFGDITQEENERFYVKLTSATNADLGDSEGIGTITNDDDPSALPVPEIRVYEIYNKRTTELKDGRNTINFGTVRPGSAGPIRKFRVTNDGDIPMTTGSIKLPAGFKLLDGLPSVINPGKSDTFRVQMMTKSVVTRSGTIRIVNSDPNENPFDIKVTGAVKTTAAKQIRSAAAETAAPLMLSAPAKGLFAAVRPIATLVESGEDVLA